jgi:hypothetical protein
MNDKIFNAEWSRQVALSNKPLSIEYTQKSAEAFKQIQALTHHYTSVIKGGKWDHIITYAPRNLAVYGMPQVGAPEILDSTVVAPKVYDRRYLDNTPVSASTEPDTLTIFAADFLKNIPSIMNKS